MNKSERIPLLSTSTKNETTERSPGYLLISVPPRSKFTKHLDTAGNYCGTFVAISAIALVFFLILGISFRANVSEIVRENYHVKMASEPSSIAGSSTNQVIETPLGSVKGYVRQSRGGRDYLAFYKVPYAKPPVGNLRFKDPQPVDPWVGVREFDNVAPSCIQKSKHVAENIPQGEEDCLYCDIYVPLARDETGSTHAVMIYVHGGGFADGNGSRYGAEYLMDENVVLVTFQYRLGLFGFLNTGDREATGNMGFKDQVMLLRWVKEYIKFFRGDPTKVTLFGNSSGGFSISFLMISPMANGLFHRAISQSGTVLCETNTIIDLQPEVTKKAVAEAFNCSEETSSQLLECLRNIDAVDLALLKSPNIKYALTIEKGFDPNNLSDVFMPDKPYELLKAGKVNRVPYIAGIVSTEWIGIALGLLSSDSIINNLNANFSLYAPAILGMELSPEESQIIKSFYFGDKPISLETERNLTNLMSDRMMVHNTKVTADFHSLASDTYLYYLSKRPAKSYADKALIKFPSIDTTNSVSHADEIQFLMPYFGYPEYPVSDTEYFPFSQLLVQLWANFAKTGKPQIEGRLMDWKPVSPNPSTGSSSWYELGDILGPTTVLDERMRFWDQFSHKKMVYDP